MDIRNIAIIAHVDHGKTTLVDGMLKQTKTFRENEEAMYQTTILDSNELEREKGITILAKNTSVIFNNTKINIIDTPGHADFSGEVERVINMADGALLVVDAAEGPLPQTQFVLEKALERNLKIIIVINKIDRKDARPAEVLREMEELFLSLVDHSKQLDFSVIYAIGREGKAWESYPEDINKDGNLLPLFKQIVETIARPAIDENKPFKMLVSTLDFDNYKGTYAIGKVAQGKVKPGQNITLLSHNQKLSLQKIQEVYTSIGLARVKVPEGLSGDIIAVTGLTDVAIGQTIADQSDPVGYPVIKLGDPTLKITLMANTSPFSGKESKYPNARQLEERLIKEKRTNIGLDIKNNPEGQGFEVSGRGELHLSILIETLRREGYEMEIGKPWVILKNIDGEIQEPFEEVTIEVDKKYIGVIVEEIGKRKTVIGDIKTNDKNISKFIFSISSRNLLGLRSIIMEKTRGNSLFASRFIGYKSAAECVKKDRNGVLIAFEAGVSTAYALETVQKRGIALITSDVPVYEGMIIGINNRREDMDINVCKSKKLTNMHTENSDIAIQLEPALILSLEQCLDFIEDDELIEVTPKALRLRKRNLKKVDRIRAKRLTNTTDFQKN